MEFQLEELKAPIEVHFVDGVSGSHHIVSKRCASLTRKLERKNGFVYFRLKGNIMHFGNGIHHP